MKGFAMPGYLTAETIKGLREARGLTQRALADAVGVTDKAVSKWESGRGLPDISLVESLSAALGVSVAGLLTGDVRQNANRAGNLMRAHFYVCPVCGNVIYALGEGSFSCCGVHLAPCEAEEPDETHALQVERIEDEWYVALDHPMSKEHFISFIAYVTMDGITLKKLYPEQDAAARFRMGASGMLYAYCNRHGLFKVRTPRRERSAGRM